MYKIKPEVTKNFTLSKLITSCNIPQTFLPFKNTSVGNFKLIFFFIQKCSIISEIIIGLIIANSSNVG